MEVLHYSNYLGDMAVQQMYNYVKTVSSNGTFKLNLTLQQSTLKPCFMETPLIRTPHYYRQFAVFLWKESSWVSS